MTLAHRHDDKQSRSHEPEREWNGPSREDWDRLMHKISEIERAMWGDRGDGIDNNGGFLAEIQKLRSVRLVAWSSIGVALSTAFTLIVGWFWNKITGGQ